MEGAEGIRLKRFIYISFCTSHLFVSLMGPGDITVYSSAGNT